MSRIVKLIVGLGLAGGVLSAAASCAAGAEFRTPAYYEARGYPIRVIRPGVRAYYIGDAWYVYRGGRWTPHGRVAVQKPPGVSVR